MRKAIQYFGMILPKKILTNTDENSGTPWYFYAVITLVSLLSAGLLLYRISSFDIREDEFQVVDAATTYFHTGTFYKWDWIQDRSGQWTTCITQDPRCHYTRAWPHTWLIAQTYKIFGVAAWSSRLPSVIFGILFVPVIYMVSHFFTHNRRIALLTASVAALSPAFITIFRLARMYALLLPLSSLLIYFLYRGLTEEHAINIGRAAINRWIGRFMNFHYGYLVIACVLLLLNALLHINSLVVMPAILLFLVYMAATRREPKYWISFAIGLLGLAAVVLLMMTTNFFAAEKDFLSWFAQYHKAYFNFLFGYPFPTIVGLMIFGMVFVCSFFIPNVVVREKIVFLCFLVGFTTIFFVFIADRYSSFNYVAHIVPFALLLIIVGLYSIALLASRLPLWLILFSFVLALSGFMLVKASASIYGEDNRYGHYTQAYQVILEQYQPHQVIFAQYPRTFYLDDLPHEAHIISLLSHERYTLDQFRSDIQSFPSGWVSWETRKHYHLRKDFVRYVREHFKKIHGKGIDNTNVEVYYFDQSMVTDL